MDIKEQGPRAAKELGHGGTKRVRRPKNSSEERGRKEHPRRPRNTDGDSSSDAEALNSQDSSKSQIAEVADNSSNTNTEGAESHTSSHTTSESEEDSGSHHANDKEGAKVKRRIPP